MKNNGPQTNNSAKRSPYGGLNTMGLRNRFQFRDRNWPGFGVGVKNSLGYRLGIECNLVVVWASKLTCFLSENRNWFCSFMRVKDDLFQCLDRNWLGLSVGVQIGLVLVLGSKLTWLQCRDRNWLDFCEGVINWPDYRAGIDLTLFQWWRRI